jgi:FtsP/CotA-like multicopper oxidase with cupredoxin domain
MEEVVGALGGVARSGLSRRQLLKYGGAAGAALVVPWRLGGTALAAPAATPTLPGSSILKYELPCVIPPAMPRTGVLRRAGRSIDYYEIGVRQFTQQVLPASLPATTVWGFGSVNHPGTFNYPSFTVEARWRKPVRVRWSNELTDPATGEFLPHLLAVDPTLHWANPPGGPAGRDARPEFAGVPGPYRGPVPFVTHVHGMEGVAQESDGYPEAWYLPDAANIPSGHATTGTFYDAFKSSSPLGSAWGPGFAVFQYPNRQAASTLWYHDHTLGMTRLNVYAGPAGFYLLRGGPEDAAGNRLPGPAPARGDRPGTSYYEIPLAIQDRSFNADGSLFYPDSREFFDGFAGPYIGEADSDISPIWNPEVFGDAILVNGRTWPYLEVEQRRYRLRILNGCNSRFLILRLGDGMPLWQIGTEGGFLDRPIELTELLLAPAERADVIVDFTRAPVGSEIILRNLGPDEPFGGGEPDGDFDAADPDTTGQVMQFRVVSSRDRDTSKRPDKLRLPRSRSLSKADRRRAVSLNEEDSAVLADVGPRAALLGTMNGDANPLEWDDAISERVAVGSTEIWELHNFTADAHPIHIHEVQFEVVGRQPFDGPTRPPERWEEGRKDTVIAYPGEITRVKAQFGVAGRFVWHCHIVEHEDNEMMRPYSIGDPGEAGG